MRTLISSLFLLASPAAAEPPKAAPTPSDIIAAAPATAWKAIPADDLLVMTLAGDRRLVIQLAPRFSRAHIANMRALAAAH